MHCGIEYIWRIHPIHKNKSLYGQDQSKYYDNYNPLLETFPVELLSAKCQLEDDFQIDATI